MYRAPVIAPREEVASRTMGPLLYGLDQRPQPLTDGRQMVLRPSVLNSYETLI